MRKEEGRRKKEVFLLPFSFFLWSACLVASAALLVSTDFRSRDPDSALYARLSTELARQPASRWIAPEWNGAWDNQGLFREHPVGILMPSVLLIRAGFPAAQAAYAVNMLYQVAVIVLIPLVAGIVATRRESRSLAWLLQLLPISFVYRIRANQEHPLLMCFLAVIYATDRARSNAGWIALTIAAFCFLVLVKGAFAMFALVAAGLWILLVPSPAGGSNTKGWMSIGAAVVSAALLVVGYEALYVRTTGESFLEFYRSTRLGQSMSPIDPGVALHAIRNIVWYAARLIWFASPWSLAAVAATWVWLRSRSDGSAASFGLLSERGLIWSMAITAVFIAVLSPANVRAERFIFPVYFIAAAAGVIASIRRLDVVGRMAAAAEPRWWLPQAVWLGTFLLSLGSRVMR
jgi:hypothetical protein